MALGLPSTASERQAQKITTHINKGAPLKRVQFAILQRKALTVCIYTAVTRRRQVTSLRSLGHGDQHRRRPSRKFCELRLAAVTPVTAVKRRFSVWTLSASTQTFPVLWHQTDDHGLLCPPRNPRTSEGHGDRTREAFRRSSHNHLVLHQSATSSTSHCTRHSEQKPHRADSIAI